MELQRQGTTLTPGTSLFDDITGTYWFPKFAAINMMLRPRNNRGEPQTVAVSYPAYPQSSAMTGDWDLEQQQGFLPTVQSPTGTLNPPCSIKCIGVSSMELLLLRGIHHIPLSPLFPPTGEDTWLKTGDELIYCEKQIWDD
ncbi:hypothetical protein MJG53_017999 [Ovis ammon polii x Ovis aries]|uniref:Uncharacterized protein n=1 Tax=Ovis ammon polii x Ovis aries TaxID=2918886 RepID=A0ACB9U626_9CETA|nr:hypothetical protein MJG53_017999 [Ovis ammon polii x Ovis aries]